MITFYLKIFFSLYLLYLIANTHIYRGKLGSKILSIIGIKTNRKHEIEPNKKERSIEIIVKKSYSSRQRMPEDDTPEKTDGDNESKDTFTSEEHEKPIPETVNNEDSNTRSGADQKISKNFEWGQDEFIASEVLVASEEDADMEITERILPDIFSHAKRKVFSILNRIDDSEQAGLSLTEEENTIIDFDNADFS